MPQTISTKIIQAPAGSLKQSIVQYALGQLSRPEITNVISETYRVDPGCGPAIQEYLDDQFNLLKLSTADYRELTQILNSTLTESVPTEQSEVAPEESGLYRIDSEGTLILSDGFEAAAPPPSSDQKGKTARKNEDSPARSVLESGTVLRDRFRLDEEVASGSMGIVYKATDLLKLDAGANSHTVAIKVINPEFANDRAALKSFQNEVTNTQLLSHPNIIHLFELDRDNEHYFITMEWLEGESLDALLDRSQGSALPPIQAYAIIEQLCDALAYSHEQNVVHADVKPGNVFLTRPGELKLIDFGIAHYDEAGTESQANDDSIALTPAYASCECLEKMKPTAQDDLFSLACLVYRLLSGRRVFGACTALQAERKNMAPVRIGGMSDGRWEALLKALSFRRDGRQHDVATFAEEFGQQKEAPVVDEPEEIEDSVHGETAIIRELPEDFANELIDPDELVAISPEQVEQLRSPDVASVIQQDGATDSSTVAQDLGEMPAPINFFDDDSDDSMFVPVASAADPVTPASTGTENLEAALASTGTENLDAAPASTGTENLEATPASTGKDNPGVAAASTGTEDLVVLPAPESSQHVGGQVTLREIELIPQTPVPAADLAESGPAATNAESGVAAAPEPRDEHVPAAKAEDGETATVAVLADKKRFSDKRVGNALLARLQNVPKAQGIAAAAAIASFAVAGILFMQADDTGELAVAKSLSASAAKEALRESPAALVNTAAMPAVITAEQNVGANGLAGGEVATPVDAFATLPIAVEPVQVARQVPLNTADTGIALMAVAVPLPLGTAAESFAAADVASGRVGSAQQVAVTVPTQAAPLKQTSQSQPVLKRKPLVTNEPVAAASLPDRGQDSTLSPYMQQAYSNAREAIAADRLVAPAYDSAVYWLGEMRVSEPYAQVVRETEAAVGAALIKRAEAAAKQSDVLAAQRWLGLASVNGADSTAVSALRKSLSAQSKQRGIQSAAVGGETAGSSTVTNLQTVALSDLEFTRFVEPEVRQEVIESSPDGWVDVGFNVNMAGETTKVTVVGSNLSSRFAAPSIAAVKKWRFEPYSLDGAAQSVSSEVRLRFGE